MHQPPTDAEATASACRLGAWGCIATLIGIVTSGPLAHLLVSTLHPQPQWQGAETFARHYHPLQALPFFAGFLLAGGYVLQIASLHAQARRAERARTAAALAFTSIAVALVFFNYIVQTMLVPELARDPSPFSWPLLSSVAMGNPRSLAWGIEMWAYGVLGIGTWLAAPVLRETRLERATAAMFVANGVTSVGSAVATAAVRDWVVTTGGLSAFVIWNVLVLAMAICLLIALGRRVATRDPAARPATSAA